MNGAEVLRNRCMNRQSIEHIRGLQAGGVVLQIRLLVQENTRNSFERRNDSDSRVTGDIANDQPVEISRGTIRDRRENLLAEYERRGKRQGEEGVLGPAIDYLLFVAAQMSFSDTSIG